jgi:hypothetical protein
MKIRDIQRRKTLKTAFISSRVKVENAKWFRENRIDLDKVIDKLREENEK